MNKHSRMLRVVSAMSLLLILPLADAAFAETCNAGHGCSITCRDGCSAVYNEDTGQCSKACGSPVSANDQKDKGGRINATFKNAPRANIDKILKDAEQDPAAKK